MLPYWSEAIVPEKELSAALSIVLVSAAAPGLKNFTSSPDPGKPALQLPGVDQFVSVPLAAVQEMVAARVGLAAMRRNKQANGTEKNSREQRSFRCGRVR